nr:winged helix-turn-helix transcriptional regulator [Gemmatimonadaceae bacterium]
MAIYHHGPESLDAVFTALGHPTRRAILTRLAKGEADVHELSVPFGLSQPTISRHLKVLETAGLIEATREAQRRPRRLRLSTMKGAADWIEPFRKLWERRLDNLDRHLASRKHARGETR